MLGAHPPSQSYTLRTQRHPAAQKSLCVYFSSSRSRCRCRCRCCCCSPIAISLGSYMDKAAGRRACTGKKFTQDVSVLSRSCLGLVSVVSWSCLGDVSVLFWWCLGHVSVVFRSCLCFFLVMSRCCFGVVLLFFWWCFGIFQWCVGDVSGMFRWSLHDVWWWCCDVYDDEWVMAWCCLVDVAVLFILLWWWCFDFLMDIDEHFDRVSKQNLKFQFEFVYCAPLGKPV